MEENHFILYELDQEYAIISKVTNDAIIISHKDGSIQWQPSFKPPTTKVATLIYGIYGTISLLSGHHLLVISKRSNIGTLYAHNIYKVSESRIISPKLAVTTLSKSQRKVELEYLALLSSLLQENNFYFSNTYDITLSAQTQADLPPLSLSSPLWKRASLNFCWNAFLCQNLISAAKLKEELGRFILPIINGFVEIQSFSIKDRPLVFALISRRSWRRVGTRFFSRGMDYDGQVSNFVETEQMIFIKGKQDSYHLMSHVQTRGSIPLFWRQVPNAKYTPRLEVSEDPKTLPLFNRHFEGLLKDYGPQIVINLINKNGYELPLGNMFSRTINQTNNEKLKYIHFDFHKECSKMRWHRISLLMNQIQEDLQSQGYFHKNDSGVIIQLQKSAVRTNCIDCLDRTNVVQSVIGKHFLTLQLVNSGILNEGESIQNVEKGGFERIFQNVWADNADYMSIHYSGTPALKTDFTRTGKRTVVGALQDLKNSIVRYFLNNYYDGLRQDAMDLFLGKYTISPDSNPFHQNLPLRRIVIPLAILFSIVMFILTLVIASDFTLFRYLYASVWLVIFICCCRDFIAHGSDFITWPRFIPVRFIKVGPEQITSAAMEKNHSASVSLPFSQLGMDMSCTMRNEPSKFLSEKLKDMLPNNSMTGDTFASSFKGSVSQLQQRGAAVVGDKVV